MLGDEGESDRMNAFRLYEEEQARTSAAVVQDFKQQLLVRRNGLSSNIRCVDSVLVIAPSGPARRGDITEVSESDSDEDDNDEDDGWVSD
jgi:hypothetical protein